MHCTRNRVDVVLNEWLDSNGLSSLVARGHDHLAARDFGHLPFKRV
jgi:hypothetical protein